MDDARARPDDSFGYSVYALVAPAAGEHVRLVAEVRRAIRQERAAIPAHVTVRGTFHGIESLDEMRGLLRETAAAQEPALVEFGPGGWRFVPEPDDRQSVLMPCVTSPQLLSLHRAFDAVVSPRSQNAYPGAYEAHMTLCQDCTDPQIQRAKELLAGTDVGTGFRFDAVDLMGRVGPAFGGEWMQIESFPLAR
jgi:2'-5' RNA ligase